jgi:hypothetical protein
MKEKTKATSNKAVITKTVDGKIYKVFGTIREAANFFNLSVPSISNKISVKKYYKLNDLMLTFETKSAKDGLDRLFETEDETRRRLGLNPYGEWRNDEWLNAMFERVNKELYPDGYDHHMEWLRNRTYNNSKKKLQPQEVEDDIEDSEL